MLRYVDLTSKKAVGLKKQKLAAKQAKSWTHGKQNLAATKNKSWPQKSKRRTQTKQNVGLKKSVCFVEANFIL